MCFVFLYVPFIVCSHGFVQFRVFYWFLFLVSFLEHGLLKNIVFCNAFMMFFFFFENVCFAHSPQTSPLGTTTTNDDNTIMIDIINNNTDTRTSGEHTNNNSNEETYKHSTISK